MDFDIEAYDDEDAGDRGVAGLLHPNAPENWDLNEKYVETSLLKLNIAMIKSGVRATEIDTGCAASGENPIGRRSTLALSDSWRTASRT